MKIVALTGGIASGKSAVMPGLSFLLKAPCLSCDALVDSLYGEEEVVTGIKRHFGEAVLRGGKLDRRALGEVAFASKEARLWLEGLFHPRVLEAVRQWEREMKEKSDPDWGLVEVPLLYEVDFPLQRDIDVVVGCSFSTQLERIERRDQLGEEQARRRISAQWPIEQKIIRADVILWNDGSKAVLEKLIGLAADRIQGTR